jgi:hypothetical protein
MISTELYSKIAWVVLQVGIGYLFMSAAWGCWRFPQWTIDETSLLFGNYGRVLAYCGVGLMAFGGAAVFLGIYDGFAWMFTRAAALALAVFVLSGAKIHTLDQKEARRVQAEIEADANFAAQARQLGDSAVFAHVANVNKNKALAAVCLFLAVGPTPSVSVWSYVEKLFHH